MSENKQIIRALEALLFINGEPLEIKKIARLLNSNEEEIKTVLNQLGENLKNEDRGLTLVFQDNRVQLATKPEFSNLVESFVKDEFEENLTPAALETLSLVAYLGPISRPKVDYIRGVNSSYTVRNLMMRGLIERVPDVQSGNAFLYQVSFDMLKHLGISKTDDLSEINRYKELIRET